MALSGTKKVKSSKIGLSNTHIAEYDPVTMKWTQPVRLEAIQSMNVSVNMAEGDVYADDMMFEIFDAFENFEVELTYADLTPEELEFLLGWDSIGAIKLRGADDDPPWLAFMGERTKADGTKRMFKYFKGKARPGNESAQTKGSSVSAQSDTLTILFGPLPLDFPIPKYRNKAAGLLDEVDPEYDGEADVWYDEVVAGQTVV
jgi:phi13 family phage major tail protein